MRVHENRILVEEIKEEKPKGALYIASIDTDKPSSVVMKGVITDIGELVTRNNIGDVVMYESFNALEIKLKESTFFVLRESDIIITL